jgi:hypothetical protein
MKHEFTLILSGITELSSEVNDALFEAGFDDSLVGIVDGDVYIDVNRRESESLEITIRQAIQDVEKAGFNVLRVESDASNVIARINGGLTAAS